MAEGEEKVQGGRGPARPPRACGELSRTLDGTRNGVAFIVGRHARRREEDGRVEATVPEEVACGPGGRGDGCEQVPRGRPFGLPLGELVRQAP
jgi:hypothetical protein